MSITVLRCYSWIIYFTTHFGLSFYSVNHSPLIYFPSIKTCTKSCQRPNKIGYYVTRVGTQSESYMKNTYISSGKQNWVLRHPKTPVCSQLEGISFLAFSSIRLASDYPNTQRVIQPPPPSWTSFSLTTAMINLHLCVKIGLLEKSKCWSLYCATFSTN